MHAHSAAIRVGHRDGQLAGAPVRIAFDVGDGLHRRGGQGIRFDDCQVLVESSRDDRPFDDQIQFTRVLDARLVGGEPRIVEELGETIAAKEALGHFRRGIR